MGDKKKQADNYSNRNKYVLELILRIASDKEHFLNACQTEVPCYHLDNK